MSEFKINQLQGLAVPETEWGRQNAKLEFARIGMVRVGAQTIWVKDLQACMTCGKEFLASKDWFCSQVCAGQWEHDDDLL